MLSATGGNQPPSSKPRLFTNLHTVLASFHDIPRLKTLEQILLYKNLFQAFSNRFNSNAITINYISEIQIKLNMPANVIDATFNLFFSYSGVSYSSFLTLKMAAIERFYIVSSTVPVSIKFKENEMLWKQKYEIDIGYVIAHLGKDLERHCALLTQPLPLPKEVITAHLKPFLDNYLRSLSAPLDSPEFSHLITFCHPVAPSIRRIGDIFDRLAHALSRGELVPRAGLEPTFAP